LEDCWEKLVKERKKIKREKDLEVKEEEKIW